MRRLTILLAFLLIACTQMLQAQGVQIKGKVTSAEDGSALPGASVVVKGTSVATVTDADGNYILNAPQGAASIWVSFVGMKMQEVQVAGQSTIDVVLQPDVVGLEEVVVTALGISRAKKNLGYSIQEVKSDELNNTRSGNVINSLSGKVAGVSITSANGNMGGSSRILIRGARSAMGNNQPLFVVDGVPMDNSSYNTNNTQRGAGGYDYGGTAADINPDDIESVSVLKGPSAAALYGARSSNGVILITTKKAKSSKGGKPSIGVEINTGVAFEQVSVLPSYQNQYGGGYIEPDSLGFGVAEINGKQFLTADYAVDESWGPKYDKNLRVLSWNNLSDWEAKGKVGDPETSPWVAPANDVETFFRTGVTTTNNVAINGNTEASTFRLSYTNTNTDGYMPNSSLKKNSVNFNGTANFAHNIKAFTTFNYVKTDGKGRPEVGYGDNNVMQKFNQWGERQLDMKLLSNYVNPDGTQRVWNRNAWDDPTPAYSNNPYWTVNKNYESDARNRFYGNAGMSWEPASWVTITGKANADYYNSREMERIAIGSAEQSKYTENLREFLETNLEMLAVFNKDINENVTFNGNLGTNRLDRTYSYNLANTVGGLIIPELYNLNNSVASPYLEDNNNTKRINSIYGAAAFTFYKAFNVEATYRRDYSSTLPSAHNTYPFYSFNTSFIFTELDALKALTFIDLGKIRASYGVVKSDFDAYQDREYYTYISNFGSEALYSVPNRLFNDKIKPEESKSFELGTELKFLQNRIGIDFTYFNNRTIDQIIPVSVSGASGYREKLINTGEITNTGIELVLNLTPVKVGDFSWDISVNYSKNKNKVVSLADGVDVLQLANGPFNVSVNAEKGYAYGSLIGSNYVFDKQGNKVVGTDGNYLVGKVEHLGSVMPDYTMGIWNTFKFKGLELGMLIDIRQGGYLFSTTNMWGKYTGILDETVGKNYLGNQMRDDVIQNDDGSFDPKSGGQTFDGVYGEVDADGNVTYTDADGNPSSTPVKSKTLIAAQDWGGAFYSGPAAQNVFKADYIKLRELRLGYTFPTKILGPIQFANISVYGRNLGIWGTDVKHIDPENTSGSGNIQGIEGGALPSVRTFGVNLKLNF